MKMETRILPCTKENIEKAAHLLRGGELVGMPTETVYGLAANALDETAVSKIFIAKGRPQDNPLIVHISSLSMLESLAAKVPDTAFQLAERFWSGPLTMILPKTAAVPSSVTAGLDTVAVRFPSHPAAQALIDAAGVPLAAPSANRSGSPSPTSAQHVYDDLQGKIPLILDGGSCTIGLESTVVSVAEGQITLLRPGAVTAEQLASIGAEVTIARAVCEQLRPDEKVLSPGMKYKHYAPKASVYILDCNLADFVRYVDAHPQEDCYALVYEGEEQALSIPSVTYGRAEDSLSQAQALFGSLRKLDELGAKIVYARCPSRQGVGLAVYNRLLRAAGFHQITL